MELGSTLPRLLVVDDDPLVCRAVARLFGVRGFEVAIAQSALEAVTVFSQVPCPVVITDLRMPGVDGLSLIEQLLEIQPCTSFVIVTASALLAKGRRVGDGSIVSVISKPWEDEDLCSAVQQAFDLHALRARDRAPEFQNLLLIEDNEGDTLLVKEMLEGTAYRVRSVPRLHEALDVLHSGSYPVVITDLSLPDARGLDCVNRIVRVAPLSATLVLTGVADDDLAAQAFRSGAEDYLVKGTVGCSQLLRAIRFALERKQAERRISELVHTDPLTGVANRPAFMDRLRRVLARSRRSQQPCAVLYLDLNDFKPINDRLGHATGDAVLQCFAERLVASVRPYDTVARLGGDEFAILLEGLDAQDDAEQVAARIVATMEREIPTTEGPLRVGTSIGISHFPDAGESPEDLLSEADAAMYRAKRSGRNHFSVSPRRVPAA